MNILFDIGHPAHVHLFRIARSKLMARNHRVSVLARDKDITLPLLQYYNINYIPGTRKSNAIPANAAELIQWFCKAWTLIRQNGVDIVVSFGSPAGAWAAMLNRIPHIAFNDTETAVEQRLLYYPASFKVYSPEYMLCNYGKKQEFYKGLHDLAYLRPEHFSPDPFIRQELGLQPHQKYVIVRFVSWDATHDFARQRLRPSAQHELLDFCLSHNYAPFISSEKALHCDMKGHQLTIPPHRLHDALAFASFVVGDGATTATEAAVLGTPSVYISSFAGKLGCLAFLEKYGLLYVAKDMQQGMGSINSLINSSSSEAIAQNRRRLLSETIDVAAFIADKCEECYYSKHIR